MGNIKTGGRKIGTPNKNTKQIRDNFQMLVEGNLEQLDQDIKSMTPKDRVKTILELSKFILPTLKAIDLSASKESEITPVIIHLGSGINPEL
jgi:hypothetical protein